MQLAVNKEEIKKQIDEIIHLMEEQVVSAKNKQQMIDNLIITTENAAKQIERLKESSAEKRRNTRGIIASLLPKSNVARATCATLLTLVCGVASYIYFK